LNINIIFIEYHSISFKEIIIPNYNPFFDICFKKLFFNINLNYPILLSKNIKSIIFNQILIMVNFDQI